MPGLGFAARGNKYSVVGFHNHHSQTHQIARCFCGKSVDLLATLNSNYSFFFPITLE